MTRNVYQAPSVEIVSIECDDTITTSDNILLPPHDFGTKSSTQNGEHDVF